MTLDNMRERCAASARLRDGPDVLLCHCYMRERSTASARAWLLCLYYGHELLSHVGFCASARAWLRRPRAQAREHLVRAARPWGGLWRPRQIYEGALHSLCPVF